MEKSVLKAVWEMEVHFGLSYQSIKSATKHILMNSNFQVDIESKTFFDEKTHKFKKNNRLV